MCQVALIYLRKVSRVSEIMNGVEVAQCRFAMGHLSDNTVEGIGGNPSMEMCEYLSAFITRSPSSDRYDTRSF